MRADTAGTLARIVEFIGTPGTAEELQAAVEFASVENMRNMELKRTFWLSGSRMVAKDKDNPNSFKVRKAKVGGYRDYFSDTEAADLEQIMARDLSPFYAFPLDGDRTTGSQTG
jgi:hypothetical protein